MYKPGGSQLTDSASIQDCVETARLRYTEVAGLLRRALDEQEPGEA